MNTRRRWMALLAALSGTLLATGCDALTAQILNTIGLGLGIADIWA